MGGRDRRIPQKVTGQLSLYASQYKREKERGKAEQKEKQRDTETESQKGGGER